MTQTPGEATILAITEVLYCDDWILVGDSPQALQAMITIIDRMVQAFGQHLSPDKSHVMIPHTLSHLTHTNPTSTSTHTDTATAPTGFRYTAAF